MQGYIQSILFTRSKVGDFLIIADCKRCITSEYFLCIFFACLQGCSNVIVSMANCTCCIQRILVVTFIAVTYSHNLVVTFLQSIITLESKSKLASMSMIVISSTLCPVLRCVFDNLLRICVVNYDANILDSLQSL